MSGISTNLRDLVGESVAANREDLRQAINAALFEAFDHELAQASTANELWEIFRATLRRIQLSAFMDSLTDSMRNELSRVIYLAEYDSLRASAVEMIIKEEEDSLYAEAVQALIESGDTDDKLMQKLQAELKSQMKDEVAAALREELSQDQEFIASVKADLKRSILDL